MMETDDVNRFWMRTNQTPAKLPAIKVSLSGDYSRRTAFHLLHERGCFV